MNVTLSGFIPFLLMRSLATISWSVARRSTATVLPRRSSTLRNFRTGNYPEERTIVSDRDAFEWQSARGGNQRPRDAGQIIDLASDQGGGLDRAGQLDKVDIETILLEDACVLGNKEGEESEAKSGITDPNFL